MHMLTRRDGRYEQQFTSLYFLADLRYISRYFGFGLNKQKVNLGIYSVQKRVKIALHSNIAI